MSFWQIDDYDFYTLIFVLGLTAVHTAVNAHGTRSETNGEIINSMSSIYLLAQRGANLNIAVNSLKVLPFTLGFVIIYSISSCNQ